MKRLVSILLVLAMVLALFAGCGPKEEGEPDILPDDQIENPVDPEEDEDSDADVEDVETEDKNPDKDENQSPGSQGSAGSKDEPSNNGSSNQIKGSLEDLIGKIYGITKIDQELGIMTEKVDLSNSDLVNYNLGLSDVTGIKEAVVSEAMMTSQAYSLVLVRVQEGGDADKIAKDIKKGIDPRKWICVMADDVSVAVYGDVILLAMISSNMDDVATTKTIISAMDEASGIKGKKI